MPADADDTVIPERYLSHLSQNRLPTSPPLIGKKPLEKFATPKRWAKLQPETRHAAYDELQALLAKIEAVGLD